MYKNILFDFDGVLAESLAIKKEAFYKLYIPFGKEIANKVSSHHIQNGGMSRYDKFLYYHKHFLNTSLDEKSLNNLSQKFSELVIKDVINSEEVKGAKWFLKKYSHLDKWIVSATPQGEIREIVRKRKLGSFFVGVYGSPKRKSIIVDEILNNHNLMLEETVLVGDSLSDYNAAIKNKIDFVLRITSQNISLFEDKKRAFDVRDFYEFDRKLFNHI